MYFLALLTIDINFSFEVFDLIRRFYFFIFIYFFIELISDNDIKKFNSLLISKYFFL